MICNKMQETTFVDNDYVLVLFSKKSTFSLKKRDNASGKVVILEEEIDTVAGQGLFAPGDHLDFCAPSPNRHSWVKPKKSITHIQEV